MCALLAAVRCCSDRRAREVSAARREDVAYADPSGFGIRCTMPLCFAHIAAAPVTRGWGFEPRSSDAACDARSRTWTSLCRFHRHEGTCSAVELHHSVLILVVDACARSAPRGTVLGWLLA